MTEMFEATVPSLIRDHRCANVIHLSSPYCAARGDGWERPQSEERERQECHNAVKRTTVEMEMNEKNGFFVKIWMLFCGAILKTKQMKEDDRICCFSEMEGKTRTFA